MIILFRWDSLSNEAADLLDEPVLAGAPVSPRPRRAPGHGAWGHAPLAGAQVRYLVVTATRIAVYSLDRDVDGPLLYRLLKVEVVVPRNRVRGVTVGRSLLARTVTVTFDDRDPWQLEVSLNRRQSWRPVVAELQRGLAAPAATRRPAPRG